MVITKKASVEILIPVDTVVKLTREYLETTVIQQEYKHGIDFNRDISGGLDGT